MKRAPDEVGKQIPGTDITILYPDQSRKKVPVGYVILHHPADEEDFTGKVIVFSKWSERTFKHGEEEYYVIEETDVLAILEEAA